MFTFSELPLLVYVSITQRHAVHCTFKKGLILSTQASGMRHLISLSFLHVYASNQKKTERIGFYDCANFPGTT